MTSQWMNLKRNTCICSFRFLALQLSNSESFCNKVQFQYLSSHYNSIPYSEVPQMKDCTKVFVRFGANNLVLEVSTYMYLYKQNIPTKSSGVDTYLL